MRAIPFLSFLLSPAAAWLSAAEPQLTHLHPAAVQAGTEAAVKLTGKFDPWPCQVWADVPGIVFTAGPEAGSFRVAVAPGVSPGPHLIRAFNAEGASLPVSMVVAATPQTADTEPNDDFRAPQVLPAPAATINGRHEKSGDVDSFAVTLTKGQVLTARVEACVLAAGFDAMLRVVDGGGQTLAFNHDFTTMDPFLAFTAPADGRYVVQTMGHKYPASTDLNFAAGDDCVYRLHLSTGPLVRHTWPLAVRRGAKQVAGLAGWNLAAPQAEIDPAAPPDFPVIFSDLPEVIESGESRTLAVPSAVSGKIEAAGEEDRYVFTAAMGTPLEFQMTGTKQGSLMDGWLKIRDAGGKELAAADDEGGSTEPKLVWTPPADGTYTVAAGELTGRGGPDFYYRLAIAPVAPTVTAGTGAHAVKIESGKAAEFKITVTFAGGFSEKLTLLAKGLPAGVTAAETAVPEKGGEVVLPLAAAAGTAAASQPFEVVLRGAEGREYPVRYSLISVTENNGVPQGYRELLTTHTSGFWLTVVPPAAPPAKPGGPAAG